MYGLVLIRYSYDLYKYTSLMKKWWFVWHQPSAQQLVQYAVSVCALCTAIGIRTQWPLKCGPLKRCHVARLICLRGIIYIFSHAANSNCVPSWTRPLAFWKSRAQCKGQKPQSINKPIILFFWGFFCKQMVKRPWVTFHQPINSQHNGHAWLKSNKLKPCLLTLASLCLPNDAA